jgi:hypothetical protein
MVKYILFIVFSLCCFVLPFALKKIRRYSWLLLAFVLYFCFIWDLFLLRQL